MPVEALLPEGLLKQQKERVGREAGGEGGGSVRMEEGVWVSPVAVKVDELETARRVVDDGSSFPFLSAWARDGIEVGTNGWGGTTGRACGPRGVAASAAASKVRTAHGGRQGCGPVPGIRP
eukprot:scaffold714_cov121-Isochrysis_galbana.AAC.11